MNKERLKRIIKNMEDNSLEQIIITSTASLFYITGLWIEPHERMIALYIDNSGNCILFGNEIFGIEKPDDIELIVHADTDDCLADIAKAVKGGKLGIDKFWASRFLIELMEHRSDVIPVLGSDPVDYARMFKDKKEIEAMKNSSKINDEVVMGAIAAIHDSIRENELASLINRLFLEKGADCEGVQLVCFGANAADPHHNADTTVIKEGDCAVFDIFTPINRYWCDMTRTVFYKNVEDEQRNVYELVKKANMSAISAIRPGMKLFEIDNVARSIIAEGGYGKYFTHRLGHNIGLECHEIPDVSSSSKLIAKPGMVFSIEPGIYLPGRFGVRIEDIVLVTENGCEVLNSAPKDLIIVK